MRRRAWGTALALLMLTVAPGAVAAQVAPQVDDPIARTLFEPELIMQHRRAIELTDRQRDEISRVIKDAQGQVVSMQWDLREQADALATELNRPRIDLDRALDRMSRVLQTEGKIKQARLTLLVRIKNILTPEQQESLRKLRAQPSSGVPEG
ncbi:MAG: periplasmic heavy metal sensor [Gemmatimonadota bacterium]